MINFKKYTNRELKQWLWMWVNCPSTRLLNSEDTYEKAIKEAEKRGLKI